MSKSERKYLKDMDHPTVLGYELDRQTLTPIVRKIDVHAAGDYGADPIGDGTFKMVPSGDVVGWDERCKRLAPRVNWQQEEEKR